MPLEYKKKPFVPDMRFLGAKLAKTVHADVASSVITDAVAVPVVSWFTVYLLIGSTQWPNQFPFNCKNSTQNAPKLVFLRSKIEIKKFMGRGLPLPTPYALGRNF